MSAKSRLCASCGHEHATMASIWTDEQRWYCHEDDHSCYSEQSFDESFGADAVRLRDILDRIASR